MTVLGIDTGYANLGFSSVVPGKGDLPFHVKMCGTIETPASMALEDRCRKVFTQILEIVRLEKPRVIAIEDYTAPPVRGGAGSTARGMNQMIGLLQAIPDLVMGEGGCPRALAVELVSVSVWHKALGVVPTGPPKKGSTRPRVLKSDVQRALKLYVDNLELPAGSSHAVDATGLGVYIDLWTKLQAKH